MTADARPENLTVAEAAVLLRLCEKTTRRLIKNGTIPAAQVGRQYIIPRSKLTAMIEELTNR